jgi:hypothetical protein
LDFWYFLSKTLFLAVKKVVLDGKKVVLDGKKTKQAMPTFWTAGPRENTQKNTKNQPKIGEFLALKVVWTALAAVCGSIFDYVK